MPLIVQRLAGLSHMVIVLLVGGHIHHLVRDNRILGIGLVNLSIGCLHKAILVDAGIACKGIDQADIGTFGRLDRAHSPIVRIMHVTNFKSRTVSGQTAGSQRGQTPLVGQLRQRIVLVHEL